MRKRSAYRPKYAPGAMPVTFALSTQMRTDLQLTPMGVLEAFREGTAGEREWHTLAAGINLAAVLSRTQPRDVQTEIEAGMEALLSVRKRGDSTGKWGCSGDEYRAIRLALILGSDMQDASSRRSVRDAIRATIQEGGA
ncbi:hypothetical protein MNJPNG_04895 [Cupriavidus oxalaticus]|uniref:hypothetical protein n=1 Tax=Cupriavidus oxalaticus TaxID=96344 RepID=UPI003F737AF4